MGYFDALGSRALHISMKNSHVGSPRIRRRTPSLRVGTRGICAAILRFCFNLIYVPL